MLVMEASAASNREATEAWSGPLFETFVRFRELVTGGLGAHGEAAMAAHPPRPGDRVVDLGCGFGDTTQWLAGLVGESGEAVGVDVSAPFIGVARKEAEEAGVENVRFEVGDVQATEFGETFDYAFSRMGIMFFANPVQALRNVRVALAPGGRFCAVVWRRKLDNEWVSRAEQVVEQYLDHPEETDEPTCGPGPFSMANADTVSEQLKIAGFEEITLQRCDLPLKIGNDLDHAVEFNMSLGPAGEVLRLWEDRVDEIRPKIAGELREALAEFEGPDGVFAPASTWIIGATTPG
jgi:SAM-dependent methyltransferase